MSTAKTPKHELEARRAAKAAAKAERRRARLAERAAEERHLGHVVAIDPTAPSA